MTAAVAAQISREANRLKMLPLFSKVEISALVDENLISRESTANERCSNYGQ